MNREIIKIAITLAICFAAPSSQAYHGHHHDYGRGIGTGLGLGIGLGLVASRPARETVIIKETDESEKDAEIARLKEEIADLEESREQKDQS